MFIDNVKIHLKAGDGGDGCVSFRREKYVSHGGPDGGDGGHGGSIVFAVDLSKNTLRDYKYHRKFIASNGENGSPGKIHGKTADDLILPVPQGTVIKDAESGAVIYDMTNCEPFVICRGGRGGFGNRHFSTPTRQTPRFAKSGTAGEEADIMLELKSIADVGLIGLPNAGKSSLLSVISAAKPKIADYRFTTLSPMLGVVSTGEGSGFIAADIPGLIEGASQGVGLGHEFLRHIERCRLLVHVVDASGSDGDPVENIKLINKELAEYNQTLAQVPQIIAANKCDIVQTEAEYRTELTEYAKETGCPMVFISAATGQGTKELVSHIAEKLRVLPPVRQYEPEYVKEDVTDNSREVEIKNVNGVYTVEAQWLLRIMKSINFDDRDSLRYFQRILLNNGVIDALEKKGVKDGDTVSIYDFEFDFVK